MLTLVIPVCIHNFFVSVYVTAYLVVVVCAFGAALSGTVWAVFVFYKRFVNPLHYKLISYQLKIKLVMIQRH